MHAEHSSWEGVQVPHYLWSWYMVIAWSVEAIMSAANCRDWSRGRPCDWILWWIGLAENSIGKPSVKELYKVLSPTRNKVAWGKRKWRKFIPPKVSLLIWRLLPNRLSGEDNLWQHGMTIVCCCSLCQDTFRIWMSGAPILWLLLCKTSQIKSGSTVQ